MQNGRLAKLLMAAEAIVERATADVRKKSCRRLNIYQEDSLTGPTPKDNMIEWGKFSQNSQKQDENAQEKLRKFNQWFLFRLGR